MGYTGKTVIVTGSSSGIGQAAVILFGRRGANVVVHGQSADKIKATEDLLKKAGVPESRFTSVKGGIQEPEVQDRLLKAAIDRFGRLDVLVNNAGSCQRDDKDVDSAENLEFVFQVNVKGPYQLIQKAVPHLEKTKGSVVNVSSIGAVQMTSFVMPYCVSKAALNHVTRGFALKLASKGIRVNTVSPGGTDTDFNTRHGLPKEVFKNVTDDYSENMVPLKRLAQPYEIAEVVLFAASDAASFLNGANIPVDGGDLAGIPDGFWAKAMKPSVEAPESVKTRKQT